VGGVDGQARAGGVGDVGAAGQVEPLPGEVAHLAHQHQARPPVDLRREVVEREVVIARPDHTRLHPALAQHRGRVHERRVLEIGEDHVVAGAPLHRAHRLVQAFRGVSEEGHLGGPHPQDPGRARPGALPGHEHLLATRHARALQRAEARAGLGVRGEPGGLAAGAEMRHPVQPDELPLVDERHGEPP
jgi:hypothetical protein